MAVITAPKYADPTDNTSFAVAGLKGFTQVYAATSIPLLKKGAKEQHVCYAQLTGTMTINCATVVSQLQMFDRVVFHFNADAGGARVVTFGSNMNSTATLSVTASKDARAEFEFDGVNLVEVCRAVGTL